jgi:tripartite-type tricarboxylate transporter receptor subunit TctC
VSYGAGGGYDLAARVLARHIGKHVPGNPNAVVQNMPGAGSRIAANYLQNSAPQDGSVLGIFSQYLQFAFLMDPDRSFDPAKFQSVGNLGQGGANVMAAHRRTGIAKLEDLMRTTLIVGSTGPQTNTEYYPAMLHNLFGHKFRVVAGYIGIPDIVLAIERGELDGFSSSDWPGIKRARPEWIKDGTLKIIAQIGLEREPELPGVPLILDLARNDEERAMLDLVSAGVDIGRPFFAGPGVPAERIAILRKAFDAMVVDPEFLDDVKKSAIAISPMSGAKLHEIIQRTMSAPASIVAKTRAALELQK